MNDILLDRNGDLNFKNGDLDIGYSDNQHQEHILIANKGEYREFPELGVGIHQMLDDDNYMSVLIEAKKNLDKVGANLIGVSLTKVKFKRDDNYYRYAKDKSQSS